MASPYISRVEIKNFRNFKSVDIKLGHKQVIVGENNVGKTNFLRAIQLILDPSLSDSDRRLSKSDFHDSIDEPLLNGTEIYIAIEIRGYENILQIVANLRDAVISDDPPTLRLVYSFKPLRDENKEISGYDYFIYKGDNQENTFNHQNRNLINLRVIKALRDVERELNSLKKSPVFQLVDQFDIPNTALEIIANELKEAADTVMELDEVKTVQRLIIDKFKSLSGVQFDNDIYLSTFDIDSERLLHTIQVLMGLEKRPVSEISLGLCNILYISLMLLLIRDRTIPEILRTEKYNKLQPHDSAKLLEKFYELNENDSYLLKGEIEKKEEYGGFYSFMNRYYNPSQGFTILAVEEPEAHLHPVLQRLIYREVLHKSPTSVIFTSHSTNITSIAPIDSIVHVYRKSINETEITSSIGLLLGEKVKTDLQRYLDAKRSELYLGAGVILVEGVAEEYLIPRFAELLELPLDYHQVVVCNVNTNYFEPYIKLLNKLNIPWCIITDGDYYEKEREVDKKGEEIEKKIFHRMASEGAKKHFQGFTIAKNTLASIDINQDKRSTLSKREFYKAHGVFVGNYTLEVDIMECGGTEENDVIKKVYSDIRPRGEQQQANFDAELDSGNYWNALSKIESNAGKGRFAQRLASECTVNHIPTYVKKSIQYIIDKVKR